MKHWTDIRAKAIFFGGFFLLILSLVLPAPRRAHTTVTVPLPAAIDQSDQI